MCGSLDDKNYSWESVNDVKQVEMNLTLEIRAPPMKGGKKIYHA